MNHRQIRSLSVKLERRSQSDEAIRVLAENYAASQGQVLVDAARLRELQASHTETVLTAVKKVHKKVEQLQGELYMRDRKIEELESRIKVLQESKTVTIEKKLFDPELHALAQQACDLFFNYCVATESLKKDRQQRSLWTKAVNVLEKRDKYMSGPFAKKEVK